MESRVTPASLRRIQLNLIDADLAASETPPGISGTGYCLESLMNRVIPWLPGFWTESLSGLSLPRSRYFDSVTKTLTLRCSSRRSINDCFSLLARYDGAR